MKKYIFILGIFIGLIYNNVNSQAYSKKSLNFDIGYVIGSHNALVFSPGVQLSFEKGVTKWGSSGIYTGFQYNFVPYSTISGKPVSFVSIPIGWNGSWHFYQMISDIIERDIIADRLDIAIKVAIGARFDLGAYSGYSTNNYHNGYRVAKVGGQLSPNSYVWLDLGLSLHTRYFLNDYLGVFVEVGYPAMGYVVAGGSLKF